MSTVSQRLRTLVRHQVDASLTPWRTAELPVPPKGGWINSIRRALGMSAGALGQRLSMSEAGVRKLEGAEMRNAITLASLQKVAEALDCEVRYALVPRQTLQSTVERRAQQVALQEMRPVAHTMVLEEQGVSAEATSMQVAERVQELLATPSKLWQ